MIRTGPKSVLPTLNPEAYSVYVSRRELAFRGDKGVGHGVAARKWQPRQRRVR